MYWISNGMPPNKIVLGIPFYAYSYTLANSANKIPGSASVGAGTIGTVS